MHIHGNSMSINAANFYAASQNEKADAARRTADVRRKLLKGAAQIEGSATSEETLLISQWTDSRHSQVQSEEQYRTASSGRDPAFR
jgi:hypothetical protein